MQLFRPCPYGKIFSKSVNCAGLAAVFVIHNTVEAVSLSNRLNQLVPGRRLYGENKSLSLKNLAAVLTYLALVIPGDCPGFIVPDCDTVGSDFLEFHSNVYDLFLSAKGVDGKHIALIGCRRILFVGNHGIVNFPFLDHPAIRRLACNHHGGAAAYICLSGCKGNCIGRCGLNAATFTCAILAHNAVVHGVIALGNKVNVKNNIICDAFEALCFAVIAVIDLAIHSPLADHVAFLRLGNDYHGVTVIGVDASSGVFARVLLNPLLVKHLIADFSFQSIKGTADSTGVGAFEYSLNRGIRAELRDIVYGTAVVNDRAVSLPAIKNIAVIRLSRQGDRCGSRHLGNRL